jgi:hypothetical protein
MLWLSYNSTMTKRNIFTDITILYVCLHVQQGKATHNFWEYSPPIKISNLRKFLLLCLTKFSHSGCLKSMTMWKAQRLKQTKQETRRDNYNVPLNTLKSQRERFKISINKCKGKFLSYFRILSVFCFSVKTWSHFLVMYHKPITSKPHSVKMKETALHSTSYSLAGPNLT